MKTKRKISSEVEESYLLNQVKQLEIQNFKYREVLELIAAPERPDGTFNRCRKACQKLAFDVLK